MTSPADADGPAPAQREAEPAWGMKFALGVAAAIMIVEFVAPGFMAAEFSKHGPYVFVINGHPWGESGFTLIPSQKLQTEEAILAPSGWLMKCSETMRRFYLWQYRLAGGLELDINP